MLHLRKCCGLAGCCITYIHTNATVCSLFYVMNRRALKFRLIRFSSTETLCLWNVVWQIILIWADRTICSHHHILCFSSKPWHPIHFLYRVFNNIDHTHSFKTDKQGPGGGPRKTKWGLIKTTKFQNTENISFFRKSIKNLLNEIENQMNNFQI